MYLPQTKRKQISIVILDVIVAAVDGSACAERALLGPLRPWLAAFNACPTFAGCVQRLADNRM